MALEALLLKWQLDQDTDALKEGLEALVKALMELEVEKKTGRYGRTPTRNTYRNGYRTRRWDIRGGTIQLWIPKLRQGTYFPSFLEPRRTERALLAVIQEEYVGGVSTRKVEELEQGVVIG